MSNKEIDRLTRVRDEAMRFTEAVDVVIKALKDGASSTQKREAEFKKSGYWSDFEDFRITRRFATAKRRSMDLTNALVDFQQGR